MAPPANANPDNAEDRLPQPYRFVTKVLDDVINLVGEKIDAIEKKRRSEEYEFTLLPVPAASNMHIEGKVTCIAMDPRGSSRFVLGTSHGQVLLVDGKARRMAAQKYPFGEVDSSDGLEHGVHCAAISSQTAYRFHSLTAPEDFSARPCVKLVVAGASVPKVFVYDIRRESWGLTLRPMCLMTVPQMEHDEESGIAPPPPVSELAAQGSIGALWVVLLLPDRTCRAYLCPPGPPETRSGQAQENLLEKVIHEEQEDDGAPQETDEFESVPTVDVPMYTFQLPGMSPLPGLSEPPLSSVLLNLYKLSTAQAGAFPRPTPSVCLMASTESNLIFHYSLQSPKPASKTDDDIDALTKDIEPALGTLLKDVTETMDLKPQRNWMLPSKTTVVTVSVNGAAFVVGGVDGSIALFNTAAGPTLKTMLPGHYGAVSGMSFYGSKVLITVGRDSWIHHYSVEEQTLLFRCLLSPPPDPPPAIKVVAAPTTPVGLALDDKGNLRLMDLRLGRKLAKMVCSEGDPAANDCAHDSHPNHVIATANGFCVICTQLDTGGGLDENEPTEADSADLFFFEHKQTFSHLFPGIEARCAMEDQSAEDLFKTLTPEQMAAAPDTVPQGADEVSLSQGRGARDSTLAHRKRSTFAGSGGKRSTRGSMSQTLSRQKTSGADSLSSTQRSRAETDDASESSISEAQDMTRKPSKGNTPATQRVSLKEMPQGGGDAGDAGQTSARLTAANLAKQAGGKMVQGTQNVAEPDEAEEVVEAPRLIPRNWQAGVHTFLRKSIGDKLQRQGRIQRRMEYLRKELEAAA